MRRGGVHQEPGIAARRLQLRLRTGGEEGWEKKRGARSVCTTAYTGGRSGEGNTSAQPVGPVELGLRRRSVRRQLLPAVAAAGTDVILAFHRFLFCSCDGNARHFRGPGRCQRYVPSESPSSPADEAATAFHWLVSSARPGTELPIGKVLYAVCRQTQQNSGSQLQNRAQGLHMCAAAAPAHPPAHPPAQPLSNPWPLQPSKLHERTPSPLAAGPLFGPSLFLCLCNPNHMWRN